jgi:hypothetical protein
MVIADVQDTVQEAFDPSLGAGARPVYGAPGTHCRSNSGELCAQAGVLT